MLDKIYLMILLAAMMYFAVYAQDKAFVKGVDFILNQCYNIGGVVVREDKSTIVCQRGSPLSEAEFNEIKPLLTKKDEWRTLQN